MSAIISAATPNTKIFDQNWHEIKQKTRLNRRIELVVAGTLTALGAALAIVGCFYMLKGIFVMSALGPMAKWAPLVLFPLPCLYLQYVLEKPNFSSNEQLEETKEFLLSDGFLTGYYDCHRRHADLRYLEAMKKPHLVDDRDIAEARRLWGRVADKQWKNYVQQNIVPRIDAMLRA